MSRTTQYIGLTSAAAKFVENAITRGTYEMVSPGTGLFFSRRLWGFQPNLDDKPVMGTIYELPTSMGTLVMKEVVQYDLWSGGPMNFTHFQVVFISQKGSEIELGHVFPWKRDPMMHGVDHSTGKFNVPAIP